MLLLPGVGEGVDTEVDRSVDFGRVVVKVLGVGVDVMVVKRPDIVVTMVVGTPELTQVLRNSPTVVVIVYKIGCLPVGVV